MSETYLTTGALTAAVVIAGGIVLYRASCSPPTKKTAKKPTISRIMIYPVKGCRGVERYSAIVTENGLRHDRQYAVIARTGDSGEYVALSQTRYPKLVKVVPKSFDDQGITLSAPVQPYLNHKAQTSGKEYIIDFYGDKIPVIDQGDESSSWFSNYLGTDVRFVKLSSVGDRKTADGKSRPNSFFYRTPLLVMSSESLLDLSQRVGFNVGHSRFRPNIVISDVAHPWAEDTVSGIRAGSLRMRGTEHCERCTIPAVDESTGVVDISKLSAMRKARAGSSMVNLRFPVKADEYYVGTYFEPTIDENNESRIFIGQEVEMYL
jgi:uncharacterized protein YcbX